MINCKHLLYHYDIIQWRHFLRYWPVVLGIHQSPMISPLTGQWREAFNFSLISAWTNCWVNNRSSGELRPHCVHYDIIIAIFCELVVKDERESSWLITIGRIDKLHVHFSILLQMWNLILYFIGRFYTRQGYEKAINNKKKHVVWSS